MSNECISDDRVCRWTLTISRSIRGLFILTIQLAVVVVVIIIVVNMILMVLVVVIVAKVVLIVFILHIFQQVVFGIDGK